MSRAREHREKQASRSSKKVRLRRRASDNKTCPQPWGEPSANHWTGEIRDSAAFRKGHHTRPAKQRQRERAVCSATSNKLREPQQFATGNRGGGHMHRIPGNQA